MTNISNKLKNKFTKNNRYANFGAFINAVNIKGFRGVSCGLQFEFPVTAITGLNGAGKSTVGQLLLCGHKKLSTASFKRWYVKDFFPVSVADPNPFVDDASVEYSYQTTTENSDQNLTVTRVVQEWSGYKRQPEKAAIYIGLAFYLPKVERPDLTIYSAKKIALTSRQEVDDGAMWASRILGNNYTEVFFQGVASKNRSAELGMANRLGSTYSENNMGFGEGRVIHTIRLLESCPSQSLVVLEEPETSLHEYAQYEFAKYLMDVSFRRGHQIVFSSHSSSMIRALPTTGRKMLSRTNDGVTVYDRLSSIHMRNALTEGNDGHLIVCVEDEFAQSFLREIVKTTQPDVLKRIKIIPFGDAKAVHNAVKVINESGAKAIGVRDGDQPENITEKLNKLPGEVAPEKLVFMSNAGKNVLKEEYQFDLDQHLSSHPSADHHKFAREAAKITGTSREVVEADCIRRYLATVNGSDISELVSWIAEQA